MKRTAVIFGIVAFLLFGLWWFFIRNGSGADGQVIYRTEKVAKGDATLSFQASGILQPLTTVDVKSKAGGEVVKLAVDEGTVVKAGDLIAEIDPRDTRAIYEQAGADLNSAQARQDQSRQALAIQVVQSRTAVETARAVLQSSKLRLQTLQDRARVQPQVTDSNIRQAQAGYDLAAQALDQLQNVTIPQTRAQAKGDFDRTQADLDTAKSNYERNQALLAKGYVSQAAVDQSRSAYESAVAAHRNADEKLKTLDNDLRIQVESAQARVKQAKATLDQAKANAIDVPISTRDLQDAQETVRQSQAALDQAVANERQVNVKRSDIQAAQAAVVRSRVTKDNAKVQLVSTTVLAPRDGVVIQKYLEEGTIIPPGTSTFAQGTSIVQIADVSHMYVEVLVDEADIAKVKMDQSVRVRLEAAPQRPITGTVSRINPAATTTNGVTQIKVRVEVRGNRRVKLMPGLNASCEFVEKEQTGVTVIPVQAIEREGDKTYVEVMAQPNKPVKREVKLGVIGNTNAEVLEGVKEGEDVVTSKIDMKQIEEQERKMEDASQQRSPFSGGGTTRPGGGGGGGARGGGGMGGGGLGRGLGGGLR